MAGALAPHYATALANAVFAPGAGLSPMEAVEQFRSAESLISGSKELERALLSPALPRVRKQALISRLAGELAVHRLIRNFLLVVVSHRRTRELAAIRREFERVVDDRLGWVPAEIASATELTSPQKQEIERVLGSEIGKFIRASYQVDPSLLAGVRARVASREYDATLRTKLESLGQRLAASH